MERNVTATFFIMGAETSKEGESPFEVTADNGLVDTTAEKETEPAPFELKGEATGGGLPGQVSENRNRREFTHRAQV